MVMKRILLIDDERDILHVAEKILEKKYEVHTVSHLEDPVNLVLNIKPHLVLIDVSIPGIGGEEAVRLLKENDETQNVPVFLFSANSEIKNIATNVGADGYLTKPFKINELKRFIDKNVKV